MRVVILAGGLGSRLQEETELVPKPMVPVGKHPLLWHIMKIYSHYGFNDFVIALGYKGEVIKDYFLKYREHSSSLTIALKSGKVDLREGECEDWMVHLLDTGIETMTGGRVKRAAKFLANERFLLTYGDGVANVDIEALLSFHRKHGKLATVTAVRPPARFGGLRFNGDNVVHFEEKSQIDEGWINGGFFVLEPGVVDYISDDETIFERSPLERLAAEGQLMAYRHNGFWQCMDTLRDRRLLEQLWEDGEAPWKVWK